MLIRTPVDRVYEAVADPRMTSQFWFTRGVDRSKQAPKEKMACLATKTQWRTWR